LGLFQTLKRKKTGTSFGEVHTSKRLPVGKGIFSALVNYIINAGDGQLEASVFRKK
jgi:hypothetical protein